MVLPIYAPSAYRYLNYKHQLYAVMHVMESEVDSFTVELVIRGCVLHLRGGVVKCNRRSAGLSP